MIDHQTREVLQFVIMDSRSIGRRAVYKDTSRLAYLRLWADRVFETGPKGGHFGSVKRPGGNNDGALAPSLEPAMQYQLRTDAVSIRLMMSQNNISMKSL